jgi:hypothetical protein
VSYALSTAPPLSMAAKTIQRVMMEMGGQTRNSGLARGREPDGTDDRLPKKEKSGNAAGEVKRPEPTAEVIAEAIKKQVRYSRWKEPILMS